MNFAPLENYINVPASSDINHIQKEVFSVMTDIYVSLFKNKISELPFFTNKKRTNQFAEQLLCIGDTTTSSARTARNVFESLTYAITFCKKNRNCSNHILID